MEGVRRGLVVATLAAVALAGLSRASFFVQSCCEALCQPTETPAVLSGPKPISFSIDNPCKATGIKLESGRHYRFEVARTKWHDGEIPAKAKGFFAWKLVPAVPYRRHVLGATVNVPFVAAENGTVDGLP